MENIKELIEQCKYENSEFYKGHVILETLGRRTNKKHLGAYSPAHEYGRKIAEFDVYLNKYWDKIYKENNVDHIYKLPDKVLKNGEDHLGNKLREILKEAEKDLGCGYNQKEKEVLLAVRIICKCDYGFLKNREEL